MYVSLAINRKQLDLENDVMMMIMRAFLSLGFSKHWWTHALLLLSSQDGGEDVSNDVCDYNNALNMVLFRALHHWY